jgi:hypothetical protein
MKTLPDIIFKGTFLELRNAARQLGGCKNWQKRQVIAAFGLEIAEMAMTLKESELEAVKKVLSAYFESRFTAEDKAMEVALKKAADRTYSDAPYEDEDDI